MKFGYFTLTDNSPAYGARRREPGALIHEILEECVEAEAMGFNSAWVPEHHLGVFGALPSPWPPPSCGPGEGGAISRTTSRNSHPAPAMAATGNMTFPSDPVSTRSCDRRRPATPERFPPPYLTRLPPPTGSGAKIDK